jgi:hypothetical protein
MGTHERITNVVYDEDAKYADWCIFPLDNFRKLRTLEFAGERV